MKHYVNIFALTKLIQYLRKRPLEQQARTFNPDHLEFLAVLMSILESLLLSEQYGIPSTSGCYIKPEPIDPAERHGIPSSSGGYIKPNPSDRGLTTLKCNLCEKSFTRRANLRVHVDSVHKNPKSFECDICGKSFNQARYMKAHVEAVHEKVKSVQCLECNKFFGSKSNLKRHVDRIHKNLKPFKCEICERCYSDRGYLENHVRFVHAKLSPFQCPECNKSFAYMESLIRHVENIHRELKPFQCPECSKSFGSKYSLKRHLDGVHKSIAANSAKRVFLFPSTLGENVKIVHQSARPNICHYCGKNFMAKTNLIVHVEQFHKDRVEMEPERDIEFNPHMHCKEIKPEQE
ncbi:hypothetical protein ACTXT7_013491 [Hymenolepis weldensis]